MNKLSATTASGIEHRGKGVSHTPLIDESKKIDAYTIGEALRTLFANRRAQYFDSSNPLHDQDDLQVRFKVIDDALIRNPGREFYITFDCSSNNPHFDEDKKRRSHGLELKAAHLVGHVLGLAGDPGTSMQHYLSDHHNTRVSVNVPLKDIARAINTLHAYDAGIAVSGRGY